MYWWTITLIMIAIWLFVAFITIIIIFKFKKVKIIIRKIVYSSLEKIPVNAVIINKKNNNNYYYLQQDQEKNIDYALEFLQFKHEVIAYYYQENKQMISYPININYCHTFHHNYNYLIANILNNGLKYHINIFKPLYLN